MFDPHTVRSSKTCRSWRRSTTASLTAVLAAVIVVGGCGADSSSTAPIENASAERAATECGTYNGRGCAPAAERVDLEPPKFSNPTEITNPLFPIGKLKSAVLLGRVDGQSFRTETTLLPDTKTVVWHGQRIRVLVSQYAAYLGGRLEEVAIDRYAQADDGSVWYLGEDVFDYRRGTVAVTEGTWLAGREGPAAMIMPAKPKVGDIYRPENTPGIVFEEVTVKQVDRKVDGPLGPVAGAIVTEELHLDGTSERKVFAPGYGEFSTAGGGNVEALAVAVSTDADSGSEPAEFGSLATGAEGILESARLRDWEAVSTTYALMSRDWKALRAGNQPSMVRDRMNSTLATLARSVKSRSVAGISQGAIDTAQSVLDLQLRYRSPVAIDGGRFHLWTQQLRVDAAADDAVGVTACVAVLEWIRDRIAPVLDAADRAEINQRLRDLRGATDAGSLPAAADHAARLGARVRDFDAS
ncbi:MAG: hypothetical protein WAO61_00240 [Solirubrobacterales bacterium]